MSLAARAGEGFVIVDLLFSIFYLVVKDLVGYLVAEISPGMFYRVW